MRRSTSICGQRKNTNFTDDIPIQLKKIFDAVLDNSKEKRDNLKKTKLAREFVERKLIQYLDTLKTIIETRSYPEIKQDALAIYEKKAEELKKYMSSTLSRK